jgi:hypothetical protein
VSVRQRRFILLGCATIGCSLAALGCAQQPPATPPYKPVTTVQELMQSVIVHAAETYWDSVQVTVDETGVHERYPESDEEWEQVWAAALTIAESGNLLMMTPRAVDGGAWMQFARSMIDAGVEAAAAADARDVDRVFAAGEQVYNVCSGCHGRYAVELQRVSGAE